MKKIVEVHELSKKYPLYNRKIDLIKEIVLPWKNYHVDHQALDRINLSISKGEHLGIIGKNGSGKSTLLKLICGVVTPSSGEVITRGSVGALLELGAGFNPQLTGRENIKFMTTLSGVHEQEFNPLIEKIISFADIGNFIDQPVKTYSSGMFVRLAFAQSIMTSPDLLIVDEALSVGDIHFQQKCIRKMEEYRKTGTIIFVSHDMAMMSKICSKVIWLERGKIREAGDPKKVCDKYLGELYRPSQEAHNNDASPKELLSEKITNSFATSESTGNMEGRILNATLESASRRNQFAGEELTKLSITFETFNDFDSINIGFIVRNRIGSNIFGTNTQDEHLEISSHRGEKYVVEFEFLMPKIQTGEYTVSVALAAGTCENFTQLHYIFDAITFKVNKPIEREVAFYHPMKSTKLIRT